jgi:capsular exopolysaccharide synthesis family protein
MDTELNERSTVEVFLEYVNLLWHWSWLLVLLAIVAGLGAYFNAKQQTPIYYSSTLVLVSGAPGSLSDSYSSMVIGQQLASTYSQTMVTRPMLNAVSEKLGYPVSGSISISPVSDTNLIRVTVMDTDPQRAADIANTLVSVFSDQIQADQASRYADSKANIEREIASLNAQIEAGNKTLAALGKDETKNISERTQIETNLALYQQSRAYLVQSYEQIRLAEIQTNASIIQKDPAVANYYPIEPQPMKSGLLGAIVGFMLAAGIIFLIEFLDDTLRDPEEFPRKWGIPVLGLIASHNTSLEPIITMSQPRSPISEAYRSLRTNLQFAGVSTPLQTLLVTSASPEDGKSSMVANLATVLAQNDRNVVVIDCDLRRPRMHKYFHLSNRIGITDYFILPQDTITDFIKTTNINGLSVITSGSLPPNPSELLNSQSMLDVIHLLGNHFNMVILDTPPLLAVTDALVLAPRVDGVILVIDPKKTKRAAAKRAIEQLRQVNANLIGVVFNNVNFKRSQYYYHRSYYYGKHYGKDPEIIQAK